MRKEDFWINSEEKIKIDYICLMDFDLLTLGLSSSHQDLNQNPGGGRSKTQAVQGFLMRFPRQSAHLGCLIKQSKKEDLKEEKGLSTSTVYLVDSLNLFFLNKKEGCDINNLVYSSLYKVTQNCSAMPYNESRNSFYLPNFSIQQSKTVPAMSTLTTGDLEGSGKRRNQIVTYSVINQIINENLAIPGGKRHIEQARPVDGHLSMN